MQAETLRGFAERQGWSGRQSWSLWRRRKKASWRTPPSRHFNTSTQTGEYHLAIYPKPLSFEVNICAYWIQKLSDLPLPCWLNMKSQLEDLPDTSDSWSLEIHGNIDWGCTIYCQKNFKRSWTLSLRRLRCLAQVLALAVSDQKSIHIFTVGMW